MLLVTAKCLLRNYSFDQDNLCCEVYDVNIVGCGEHCVMARLDGKYETVIMYHTCYLRSHTFTSTGTGTAPTPRARQSSFELRWTSGASLHDCTRYERLIDPRTCNYLVCDNDLIWSATIDLRSTHSHRRFLHDSLRRCCRLQSLICSVCYGRGVCVQNSKLWTVTVSAKMKQLGSDNAPRNCTGRHWHFQMFSLPWD